ncbi:MAG: cation diffusion facilitator family transporter [Clostridiales bacterium]|nr:cation diffusion facilitator family transporter [Clostridiales bacterium]
MNILYKIFRLDPNSREGIITVTSGLGIIVNFMIALLKIIIGFFASSIAIISDGVNNATDALTSILALLGAKLAEKHPDEKHPFGYGRIEYLASLSISVLILVTGYEIFTSSLDRIFHPEPLNISTWAILIIVISAAAKFFLGVYTIRMGKKADSKALEAVGLEGRNDSLISVLTLASFAVYMILHVSVDAFVGIVTSIIILKTGFEVLKDTVSEILGRPGQKELAQALYRKIRKTEGILGAADMILHNYGPDSYSGSVNIEIDHNKSIGEIYQNIHKLQLDIMHEYHVTMVFGIYAVDNDGEEIKELRKYIGNFVREQEHAKSFHALYLDKESHRLYCDIIVDYKLRDWEKLRTQFEEYISLQYPEYETDLTIETEFI